MNDKRESSFVRVRIYDREYVLRVAGDTARLEGLCAILDKKMHEVAHDTGAVDTSMVAVLAALRIADDLQRARDDLRKLDDAIGKRSIACVSMLDRFSS